MNEETKRLDNAIQELKQLLDQRIVEHEHDGSQANQVKYINLFGATPSNIPANPATIATTGNTDVYIVTPISGRLTEADFSGVDALAASDTNYITFTITNLGQSGSGTAAMLAATDTNTTKATGGSAISANTVRALTINQTSQNTEVTKGDRLRIRAAVTGTLANTITFPVYILRFI